MYAFNRNVILEAAMVPLKLSIREAVVATDISATADSSYVLPWSTKTTKTTITPAGNRKHTEKRRSLAKQILQPRRHQRHLP
jgi:hypothetical protein